MGSEGPCCVACGLLSLKNPHTNEYEEADNDFRTYLLHPPGWMGPRCVLWMYDLHAELSGVVKHTDDGEIANMDEAIQKVFHTQRDKCIAVWEKWIPTHSPKEHVQMRLLHEIEERNREWQRKIEAWANTRATWTVVVSVIAAVVAAVLTPLVQAWLSG